MATFHFHTCRAAKWKFYPSFAVKMIPPPLITRPGGQYESDDEKVLKGPKVAQLLRTVIKLRDGHKELTLELKSIKDDYNTLRRGLGIKIECLEKCVEKGNL